MSGYSVLVAPKRHPKGTQSGKGGQFAASTSPIEVYGKIRLSLDPDFNLQELTPDKAAPLVADFTNKYNALIDTERQDALRQRRWLNYMRLTWIRRRPVTKGERASREFWAIEAARLELRNRQK